MFTEHAASVKVFSFRSVSLRSFTSSDILTPMVKADLNRPLSAIILLALLSIAIYSNTFSASFHFDDVRNIAENPWIKNLSNLLDLSGSRYVGFLSFALNYHFGRLNVLGYHLINLLIHITNGVLVYTLVLLLFRASSPGQPHRAAPTHLFATPNSQLVALATALLFVAHPIQTQAVTYIVQRFTSLAALFYLLTVVFYLKWRLASRSAAMGEHIGSPLLSVSHLWYAGALIATILAMKTKENTFTLPFMLLLVEAVFFAPLTRKSWFRLIPFFLTLPIIPLSRPGALGEGEAPFASDITEISRPDYLFTQFRVIVTYLRLLVFPVDQNHDYDYPVYHSLFDPPVLFSFLFLSALFALALYLLFSSRHPFNASRPLTPSASRLTAFGILWFFLTLSIESSIIPIRDVIFEHRLYLPSVGFFLAAGVAAFGFSDRGRLWKAIGIGGIVAVLSVATYQRNKIWQDEFTFWRNVVQKSPQKARAYNGLGGAYAGQKRWEEAIPEYKTALTFDPGYAKAHNNLGLAFSALGRYGEAIQEYKTALTLQPDLAEAHNNLGLAYSEQGALDDAIREFQTALELRPDHAESHNNLGAVYSKLGYMGKRGYLERAVHEYETASSLNPDYAEPYYNLGNTYRDIGRVDKAIDSYRMAVKRNPEYALAQNNLGLGYYVQGRLPEALAALKEAIRIKPDYVEAHNNLGVIYKAIGRPQEAIQEFQTAIKLKPDHVDAYYNLGNTYQRMGRIPEATQAFEDALKIKPDYEKARQALKSLSQ